MHEWITGICSTRSYNVNKKLFIPALPDLIVSLILLSIEIPYTDYVVYFSQPFSHMLVLMGLKVSIFF